MSEAEFKITPPTLEEQFRWALQRSGVGGSPTIEVALAFRILKSFVDHERDRNDRLMDMVEEYQRLSIKPIVYTLPATDEVRE